jgi:hypothetical protein
MVKNIEEVIPVPASFLVSGLGDLDQEAKIKLSEFAKKEAVAKSENKAVDESERQEAASVLPDKIKADLAAIGASLPSDYINLTMKLGDFLYHIYSQHVKPAQAPLAIKRHEKTLMDLAEKLSENEFDVPESVLKAVEDVLADEKKWSSTQFGVTISVGGSQKYIGISSLGASIFKKIMDSAVSLF